MSILEDIVNSAKERKVQISENIRNSFYRKSDKDIEYFNNLGQLADECSKLLQDIRYPKQQEFLKEIIETLQDSLQHILARNINNLNRQDSLLKACAIAGQIEAYKNIITRPKKILKEYEEYRKMIKKEMI